MAVTGALILMQETKQTEFKRNLALFQFKVQVKAPSTPWCAAHHVVYSVFKNQTKSIGLEGTRQDKDPDWTSLNKDKGYKTHPNTEQSYLSLCD